MIILGFFDFPLFGLLSSLIATDVSGSCGLLFSFSSPLPSFSSMLVLMGSFSGLIGVPHLLLIK